jgi:hypothetical protein
LLDQISVSNFRVKTECSDSPFEAIDCVCSRLVESIPCERYFVGVFGTRHGMHPAD